MFELHQAPDTTFYPMWAEGGLTYHSIPYPHLCLFYIVNHIPFFPLMFTYFVRFAFIRRAKADWFSPSCFIRLSTWRRKTDPILSIVFKRRDEAAYSIVIKPKSKMSFGIHAMHRERQLIDRFPFTRITNPSKDIAFFVTIITGE